MLKHKPTLPIRKRLMKAALKPARLLALAMAESHLHYAALRLSARTTAARMPRPVSGRR
jgi:hypothetical protein